MSNDDQRSRPEPRRGQQRSKETHNKGQKVNNGRINR